MREDEAPSEGATKSETSGEAGEKPRSSRRALASEAEVQSALLREIRDLQRATLAAHRSHQRILVPCLAALGILLFLGFADLL